MFAGGRGKFMHKTQTDPEYPDKKGERLDGRNLIQEWLDEHSNSEYVWNKTQFDKIDVEKVDHVIGMSRNILGLIVLGDFMELELKSSKAALANNNEFFEMPQEGTVGINRRLITMKGWELLRKLQEQLLTFIKKT